MLFRSDVREELSDLEGITLLLEILVVERRARSLIGLLCLLTSGHLSLCRANLSGLLLKTEVGGIHASGLLNASGLRALTSNVLTDARSSLSPSEPLCKLLLTKALNGLTLRDVLTEQLLTNVAEIGAGALHSCKTLLTKRGKRLPLTDILIVEVLTDLPQLGARTKSLLKTLLTKLADLSASAKLLGILLLPKSRQTLPNAKQIGRAHV